MASVQASDGFKWLQQEPGLVQQELQIRKPEQEPGLVLVRTCSKHLARTAPLRASGIRTPFRLLRRTPCPAQARHSDWTLERPLRGWVCVVAMFFCVCVCVSCVFLCMFMCP